MLYSLLSSFLKFISKAFAFTFYADFDLSESSMDLERDGVESTASGILVENKYGGVGIYIVRFDSKFIEKAVPLNIKVFKEISDEHESGE